MGWKAEAKAVNASLYGWYCKEIRSFGYEPMPYHLFVDRSKKEIKNIVKSLKEQIKINIKQTEGE